MSQQYTLVKIYEDERYIHKIEFKSTGMVFLTFSVLSLGS